MVPCRGIGVFCLGGSTLRSPCRGATGAARDAERTLCEPEDCGGTHLALSGLDKHQRVRWTGKPILASHGLAQYGQGNWAGALCTVAFEEADGVLRKFGFNASFADEKLGALRDAGEASVRGPGVLREDARPGRARPL